MGSKTFSTRELRLELDETPEETVVRCSGKITTASAEMFYREIRGHAIPDSRGKGMAFTCRVVVDLSNVTYVDNTGLSALLAVWKAGQSRGCNVEIINLGQRAGTLAGMSRLDQAFNKIKGLLSSAAHSFLA